MRLLGILGKLRKFGVLRLLDNKIIRDIRDIRHIRDIRDVRDVSDWLLGIKRSYGIIGYKGI